MKKLLVVIALVMSVATLSQANNQVESSNTTCPDCVLWSATTQGPGPQTGTWSSLPSLVQTIINNNTVVPATVGTSLNSGAVSTVGNVDITGTGIIQTVTGSGAIGTSSYDFSNLQTVQGNTNATNITNLSNSLNTTNTNVTNLTNTVNSNSTDISSLQTTVANHTTQINQNTSDISTLQTNVSQNTSDINTLNSNLSQTNTNVANLTSQEATDVSNLSTGLTNETNRATSAESSLGQSITNETTRAQNAESSLASQETSDVNTLTSGLNTTNTNVTNLSNKESADVSAINNMSDPTTVLNKTVNGNTAAIAAETTRAEGAEGVLQNNINAEANTRAAADQALQNQINNVNAQAQDNTNRIDRLEETKYLLEPTVRLYDDKHFQVQAFDSYDVRHGMNSALGMRVMFKLGKSYEEKLISKTNPEIARLLSANVSSDIAERNAIRKQLAEDRELIQKQADLLAKLSAPAPAGVLSVPVSHSDKVFGEPSKADEDLLQAMDDRNEAAVEKK